MKTELEKQLERDLKRHREENKESLPKWARPVIEIALEKREKKVKKDKKKK